MKKNLICVPFLIRIVKTLKMTQFYVHILYKYVFFLMKKIKNVNKIIFFSTKQVLFILKRILSKSFFKVYSLSKITI
jgi:hypothetical protein